MRYEISTGDHGVFTDDLDTARVIARALSSESGTFVWVWDDYTSDTSGAHVARYHNGENET